MDRTKSLLRIVEWLLDRAAGMPREANRKWAQGLGKIWYRIDGRHRKIALRNLELAWGEELNAGQRKAISLQTFIHLVRVVLELPYLRTLSKSNIEEFVVFSGLEHVEAALGKNKGVFVMASHFGNWEMMSLGFSMRCRPFNVVIRPLDSPLLDRLIDGIRCRTGNQTIPKKGSVRQVLRLIRRKEIVALLIDQNVDWYDGVFVPFFREIACTNKALAVLALRTGAPVVPVHNVRRPDGRYETIFEPEVELIRTGDTTSDIEQNTALFNRIIERHVRENPAQWFWLHQRWKTRPYKPWPKKS